jgi:hypothetical protein
MEGTIHEAEQAYNDREQAKANMETLKKEAEKEQQEFQNEWGKLENLIDKDKHTNTVTHKDKQYDNSLLIL